MKTHIEKKSQKLLGLIKQPLWCSILVGVFFSLMANSVAFAQTNIYKSLQYPFYDPEVVSNTAEGGCAVNLDGPNKKAIWDFLRSQGLSELQTAGFMGNMRAESGFEPRLVEYGWPNSRGEISVQGQPSSLDDNVPPDVGPKGQPGYGLVQWTGGRKQPLRELAASKGIPAGTLSLQLEYLWQELTTNSYYKTEVYEPLLATTTLKDATELILIKFEVPTDIEGNKPKRLVFAEAILAEFTGTSVTSSSLSCDISAPAGATIDLANLYKDSTNVGCASGTRELPGEYDGYVNKEVVKIKLCALPNLPCSNAECNGGYGVIGGNGEGLVNSRVSGAWFALVEAARKVLPPNLKLTANSTFRTMANQEALWAANPNPVEVAEPGTSNHQMGLAIDFDIKGISETRSACIDKNGVCTASGYTDWEWLNSNASKFGFKQYENEFWHFSPTGG